MAGTQEERKLKRRLCAGSGAVAVLTAIILVAPTFAGARRAGDLDPSFGQHGLRIVPRTNGYASSVAVGRKGRILVAGGDSVARLLPNGRLDHSFANRGIARLDTTPGIEPTALAVARKGGSFVVGDHCAQNERCGFAVSHLKRDGEADHSFGAGGAAVVDFPFPEFFTPSIAIAHGGKLVVTGLVCRSYLRDCNLALARLDRNGRLDRSFGDNGKVVASLGPGGKCPDRDFQVSPMALDSRGRIVMGASCGHRRERSGKLGRRHGPEVALARFEPNGHLDRSFGKRGTVDKRVGIDAVVALAIDAKDRIDVAGRHPRNGWGVVRFQRKGKLDSSFGHHGTAGVKFREKHVGYSIPLSEAIDSRGRIVLAGEAFGFSFARFTPKGHVDRRFGNRGTVVTGRSVVKGSSGQGLRDADSVAIDRRDRIVGAGFQRKRGEHHFAVVRLIG